MNERRYPKQHKLGLVGALFAVLAVIPAWWHLPFDLALALDLPVAIHAPDMVTILIIGFLLAAYHLVGTSGKTNGIAEIIALLMAVGVVMLLGYDIKQLASAYTPVEGLIAPPNFIFGIVGIIGALATAGASASILIDIASERVTGKKHP